MPRIILLYPFLKHYAGSVFDVEEAKIYEKVDWIEEKILLRVNMLFTKSVLTFGKKKA